MRYGYTCGDERRSDENDDGEQREDQPDVEADDGTFDGVVPVAKYRLPSPTSERPYPHVIEQARGEVRLAESDPAHREEDDAPWRVAKVGQDLDYPVADLRLG